MLTNCKITGEKSFSTACVVGLKANPQVIFGRNESVRPQIATECLGITEVFRRRQHDEVVSAVT